MEHLEIVEQIKKKLAEIEQVEDVRIIMAVESGSRSWGFASPDSDYDVRFVYVRRPECYIRLKPMRDVIEWQLDDVYDVSGWDLQKTLRLMYDSNPAIHEWCNSPIVYKENELAEPLRRHSEECFTPKKSLYHYISMAKHNFETYLTGDEVRLKKYFYGLRPVLAARWVMENGTVPPMLFDDLVETELPPEMRPVVEDLLALKKETSELGTGPQIPEINKFIAEQMDLIREAAEKTEYQRNDREKLEVFFRDAVFGRE